jgi:hypothetical protein
MKRTYHGSCHCGRVRFEADIDLAAGSGRCNCSYCAKRRNWSVIIKPADFSLISGNDDLADYQFGGGRNHHRFCMTCGIATAGDGDIEAIGGPYVSVSVACLDDVPPDDLAAVPITYMDGRDDNWFVAPKVTSYL